jgi:signal transduction histidine kinase
MKPVDIHEGIESTLMLLQQRFIANSAYPEITINKEYAQLPLVTCYASQLNQVFMNILNNAIDAVHKHNQKRSLAEIEKNPSKITICTQLLKNNWVRISIQDNGTGIPHEIKERIFDRFFTTKPVGEGTVLGLSISYQIFVDKHRGILKYISEVGKGTQFWIDIPMS